MMSSFYRRSARELAIAGYPMDSQRHFTRRSARVAPDRGFQEGRRTQGVCRVPANAPSGLTFIIAARSAQASSSQMRQMQRDLGVRDICASFNRVDGLAADMHAARQIRRSYPPALSDLLNPVLDAWFHHRYFRN